MYIYNWWKSLDKILLLLILFLHGTGLVLIASAGYAVAKRIGMPDYYFLKHQIAYTVMGLLLMCFMSTIPYNKLKQLSIYAFFTILGLLIVTLLVGVSNKGARRWIYIFGLSLQSSEFMKPVFAIFTAYLLEKKQFLFAILSYAITAILIMLQPDFGMLLLITCIWASQVFVIGIDTRYVIAFAIAFSLCVVLLYFQFPHIQHRIDKFIHPEKNYQVTKALESLKSGNFVGKGIGNGSVKYLLPDSHTDFIFAVIGEELGIVFCMLVLFVYAAFVLRLMSYITTSADGFKMIALHGLTAQIAMQSAINMCVSIGVFPTKGMTLPFVSYGGSSTLSGMFSIGIVFSLVRRIARSRLIVAGSGA